MLLQHLPQLPPVPVLWQAHLALRLPDQLELFRDGGELLCERAGGIDLLSCAVGSEEVGDVGWGEDGELAVFAHVCWVVLGLQVQRQWPEVESRVDVWSNSRVCFCEFELAVFAEVGLKWLMVCRKKIWCRAWKTVAFTKVDSSSLWGHSTIEDFFHGGNKAFADNHIFPCVHCSWLVLKGSPFLG